MPVKDTIYATPVAGVLPFPIDMLRYDACWPASEEDSHLIECTLRHETDHRVLVTVYHRRYLLTAVRWESFGWSVVGPTDVAAFT